MKKSLSEALRERAKWLEGKSDSHLENPWGDVRAVRAAILEIADVISSWSGEIVSKEEAEEINRRRRGGYMKPDRSWEPSRYDVKPLSREERIQIAQQRRLDKSQKL